MAASVQQVLQPKAKRKLLALDGGGIRGVASLEILAAIERHLRERSGNAQLVLADFFDYVGGTSTGAILATCVALGMPVEAIRRFYHESGALMFDRAGLLDRYWRYRYTADPLSAKLQEVIGPDEVLGSERLRTLLLLVMRNATTDSPWPLSNNPNATYNNRGARSNLAIPLWQLVRASTAAPTYFPPEVIDVGASRPFVFVDGGVTTYNNPAFLLFLMATVTKYQLGWPVGAEKMLLVSIGTGSSATANDGLLPGEMNLLYNATKIPAALMYGALVQQDTLCRVFGDCRFGAKLDREIDDLRGVPAPGGTPKLFSYCRYDPELSRRGLDELGLERIPVEGVEQMDSVDHIAELAELGRAYAERFVLAEHFDGFA
jgi:hypothetical protein